MEEEEQQITGWKSYLVSFNSFWIECKRVLLVTKKPSGDEFKTVIKVAGAGILLIGLIGFLITLITSWFKG